MRPARLPPVSALAAASAGAAAWCSLGVVALSDAGPRAARVAVLPPLWLLAAMVGAAILIVWALRLQPDRAKPLFASAFLFLPWLPVRLPAEALLPTGPMVALVWAGIAAVMLSAGAPAAPSTAGLRAWFARPARAPWAAFICAAIIYVGAAWRLAPLVPGGDEPHYLVIAQSLWRDGDLRIEDNHRRGDYLEYFGGTLKPDYLKRGVDGQIYSIHLPGISALVAPVLALGGYASVKLFLALLSAAAAAAAWKAAFAVTGSVGAAWFGWAGTALTTPVLLLSFTVYPDGPGAVAVVLAFGLLATLGAQPSRPARWWASAGLLAALLPWFHPRFAVLAAALGIIFTLRAMGDPKPVRSMVAFALVPAVSAVGWFGYYYTIYGRLNPSVAYGHYTQMSIGRAPTGVLGLLFDQQYGLIVSAPVFAIGLAGLVPLARRHARLAVEWCVVVVPYIVVTAMYHMWWGGFSSPARFVGATLPLFALPMAAAWAVAESGATRALQSVALGASAAISLLLLTAEGGAFVFNVRDVAAPFLVWASQMADLTRAVPSLFRHGPATALAEAAVWGAAVMSAWLASRYVARAARLAGGAAGLVTLIALGVALTAAVGISWRVEGASGLRLTFGQLRALDAASGPRESRAAIFEPPSIVTVADAMDRLRLASEPDSAEANRVWPALPYLPAGRYRLWAELAAAGELELSLVSGRVDGPFESWRVLGEGPGSVSRDVVLPIGVSLVAVGGDAAAKATVRRAWLQPAWGEGRPVQAAGRRASAARRYGDTVVYAIAGAYLEPDGLWAAGERIAELVVQVPARERHAVFTLRAGPVATPLYVRAGAFELKAMLAPGETRELPLPVSANGSVPVLIHAVRGFRPADLDPSSADRRLLGVRLDQKRTTPPK